MRCLLCVLPGLVVSFSAWAAAADTEGARQAATAMQLVHQALDADLAGRKEQRAALLQQALERSPQYSPARWHSGHIMQQTGWLPVQAAQRVALQDRGLREYRQLRDRLDGSADSQATLARFCRKQQWKDREEFHWANVLRQRPGDKEARSALELQEYRGMLMTAAEIARYKEVSEQAEAALKHWQPLLAELRDAINSDDAQRRSEAAERLAAVRDLAAIPAIALSLPQGSEAYCLAAIAALAGISDQAATDALVWQAVVSPYEEVRLAAAQALKPRPMHSYVPVLMGGLTSPLELTYYISAVTPGDLKYGYTVLRDGPVSQVSQTVSRSSEFFRTGRFPAQALPMYAGERTIQWREALATRAAIGQQVASANQITESQNERFYAVLEKTTGKHLSRTPQAWWKWWDEHNELHADQAKPIRSRHFYSHTARGFSDFVPSADPDQPPRRRMSCFIPGTLVWTEAGLEPIEKLRPGDRVLSQDPRSGELALKFIAETTLRPPSPTLRVQVASEVVVATRGHPFWSVGKGWRMAKELEAKDRLYTLEGSAAIVSVEEGPEWQAHNLVIEGFGTYFVGKQGLLVRDNALGRVSTDPLPGYSVVATKAE